MAEIYKGVKLTNDVDKALQKQLIDRGQTSKISTLKPETNTVKEFGSSFLDTTSKVASNVGSILGGGKLFEGAGYALATPYINKLNTQSIKTGNQLNSTIDNKINQAKLTGNKSSVTNLLKIKKNLNTSPNIIETSLSEAPTNKQILASAGQLALTASLGLKSGLPSGALLSSNTAKNLTSAYKATKSLELANKIADASTLGKATLKALNYTGKITKNTAIGAGMMALGELELKKDATLQSVIKQAELGAGIGLVAELSVPIITKGFQVSNKFLTPLFKNAGDSMLNKLNQVARGNVSAIDLAKDPQSILNSVVSTKKTISQLAAQKTLDVVDGINSFKSRLLDRFSAIKPVQEKIEGKVGFGVQPSKEEKVYTNVRLLDERAKNAADEAVKDFDSKMLIYKDILPEVKTSMLHLDAMDRVSAGVEKLEGGIPADLPLLTASYKNFMDGLSPEVRKRIGTARQVINDWTDTYLQKRLDQGILSQQAVDEMKRLHPNYIPHNVIMDAEEDAMHQLGSSLNVSASDIKKALGSTRLITDPIEAIKQRTYIAERLLAKNQFIKDLVTTGDKYKVLEGLRPITTAEQQNRRINLLTQLKESFKVRNKLDDVISKENSNIRFLEKKEKTILGKKFTSIINNFKASEIGTKLKKLTDRAQTMASEFEPKTKINKYLNKAKTQEERLLNIKSKIAELADKFKEAQTNKALDQRAIIKQVTDLKNKYYIKLDEVASNIKSLQEELDLAGKGVKNLGEETLSFFRDGKLEKWVVPQDIAVSIKNLDFQATPGWFKFITAPSQAMKKMATTLNLSFSVPNKFRDEQTAYVMGNSMIDELSKRYGLTPQKINMTADEFKNLYRESGGFGSGIFQEGENALKGNLSKSGLVKVVDKVNPVNILENLNTAIEQDTRLKVFRRALEAGAAPEDAALISRNASIDFSKMGSMMKDLNRAIPFLNARVQGFVNMAETLKSNPEMFARTLMQTSVYPTLVLQQHNMNFDSYANISQAIKNKNFIIMFGETDGYDNSGNKIKIPQFLKIPKGESQTIVSNPLQYYLDRQADVDKRSVQRMLSDTVGAASPISYQSWDSGNMLGSMLSQFGPSLSIPAGLAANKNLYTGAPIIPTAKLEAGSNFQYGKNTPDYLKSLTKTLNENVFGIDGEKKKTGGIAPSQVEFVLNSMGGLPQDISNSIDLISGVINDEDAARQPMSNTLAGRLAVTPGFRSIIGEDMGLGTTEIEAQRQIKKEAVAEQVDVTVMKNEMLDKEVKKINKMDQTTMSNYLKQKVGSGEMTSSDLKEILQRKKLTKTIGVLAKSDDPDVKASVIAYQLGNMQDPEEKRQLLTSLVGQQLIDANVMKKVVIYQNNGIMDIVNDLQSMGTSQQKQAYLTDLVKKGLIDKDVLEQVTTVLKYEQQ